MLSPGRLEPLAYDTAAMRHLESSVLSVIRNDWGLGDAEMTSHGGGMNSRTWIVRSGGHRWVAKLVPPGQRRRFVSGLAVASLVDEAGIPSGRPEPTILGRPWAQLGDSALALLRLVEGHPLTGRTSLEQRLIGVMLARVHRGLRGQEVPDAEAFHWLDPDAPHLAVEPWVGPAVHSAIASYGQLPPTSLSWGLLHSDPAPEAFLLDRPSGTCALIDWDFGLFGPLMYDVASAVMYVGGADFGAALLEAYVSEGVMNADEVDRSLDVLLRLRWAVQADYFARRVAANDMTGIQDSEENRRGLEDARAALLR